MSILECNSGQKWTTYGMIQYITHPKKTMDECVFTVGTDSIHAYDDFMFTKLTYHQYDPNKREYYQFIVALDKQDISNTSLGRFIDFVQAINYTLARWVYQPVPEFQVISAIHFDKAPIYHVHIVVNNISSYDGHRFPWDNQRFWLFRNLVNRLLIYYGFTPIPDERLNERSKIPNYFIH